jgi:CxxC-x17-CxxC domain-containing protein
MKDFKRSNDPRRDDRGGRSFGGGSFGGGNKFGGDRGGRDFNKPRFNNGGGEDRPMFPAVCDDCGKSCQVPFRPSGDKPVRCSDCFGNNRETSSRDDRGPRDFNKPAFSKNVYRDTPSQSTPDFKSDFIALGQKLDTVISLLQGMQAPKKDLGEIIKSAVTKEVAPKATKEVKVATKKEAPVKKVAAKKVTKVVTKTAVKKAIKKTTKK